MKQSNHRATRSEHCNRAQKPSGRNTTRHNRRRLLRRSTGRSPCDFQHLVRHRPHGLLLVDDLLLHSLREPSVPGGWVGRLDKCVAVVQDRLIHFGGNCGSDHGPGAEVFGARLNTCIDGFERAGE